MTRGDYEKNSITLPGAVAMGTGVMIGAGIFALTGQIAELAGPLFPLSFIVGGIALFGAASLWASGISFEATSGDMGATRFVASVALSILAFKGFTTITNSGAEVTDPHRNVGRAIVWSIAICVVVYLLVAFAVGSSLPLDRIVAAKDYALAEAADPALGRTGFYLTVALALVATLSGLIASVFAVSRMLAAFTAMKWQSDPLIVVLGAIGMALVFLFVRLFLARNPAWEGAHDHY